MNSLDDSIWTEFDNDLLSLVDMEPTKQLDQTFKINHQTTETFTPSFTTARGKLLPPPSKEASLKYAKLLESTNEDQISIPISTSHALFLPPPQTVSNVPHNRHDSSVAKDNGEIGDSNDDLFADIPNFDDIFAPPSSQHVLPPPNRKTPLTLNNNETPVCEDVIELSMYKYATPIKEKRNPDTHKKIRIYNDENINAQEPTSEQNKRKFIPSLHENDPKRTRLISPAAAVVQENYERDIQQFGGFKMGNSKQTFELSSQARKKAMDVLDTVKPSGFTKASGASLSAPTEKGMESAASLLKDTYKSDLEQFGGFQTGNGKKSFDISSQATRKAISLLDEDKKKDEVKQYKNDMNQFGGFQTGGGKKSFEISSQAARNAMSVFEQEEEKKVELGGFQTAAGKKKFEISSQAKRTAISVLTKEVEDKKPSISVIKPDSPLTNEFKKPVSVFPKRNTTRPSSIKRQNKPFKSPIIQSNFELTKAAVSSRATSKTKLTPVFDLKGNFI